MSGRVRGYHYVRDPKTGRKRRVYSGATRSRSTRRRGGGRSIFGTVYGRGAYYGRRARQPTVQRGTGPRGGRSTRGSGFLTLGFGGTDPPKMQMGKGGMVVSHREYIQDITSSVPFIGENFPLNPGIQQTFPWLSQIADNFEEWIPEAIIFEYKTTSSNTVVNTTNSNPGLGTVIVATQYNSLNRDFGNKQQMENYENAVSVDPSRSVVHAIECAKGQTPVQPLYVRTGPPVASATSSNDLRFYDHGVTTIATVGQQTNNFVIGELWVSYRIRFLKPRLQTGVGNNERGVVDHFRIAAGGTGLSPFQGSFVPSRPFGNQMQVLGPPADGSTLGGVLCADFAVTVAAQQSVAFPPSLGGPKPFPIFAILGGVVNPVQVPAELQTYYFPPGISSGIFMVVYTAVYAVAGTVPNQVVTANPATNGCQIVNRLGNDLVAKWVNTAATTTTTDGAVFFIEVLTNYANFSMSGTDGMTTITYADLTVMQMPPNYL